MTDTTEMKRSLKLVLVTETFPPEVNGVARTLGRWVETFRARGHEVQIIRPRRPGEPYHPDLVHGQALPFYRQVRLGVAGPIRICSTLQRMKPDLVHIATEGPLGFSALTASWWLNIPVASSFHTNFDHYAAHYGFLGIEWAAFTYLRWFHNRTCVTLVPSQATRARLLSAGMQRVEIWSRGVQGQQFNPKYRDEEFRRSLGIGPDGILLVYVGRLAPEKNIPVLLQSYARLRSSLSPARRERMRLALVGSGPLMESLQFAIPAGVILAGEHHGLALSRWYASGDIFAFPSQSETFGNVVLEAQASGLPVVGYDCQGVNEQVIPGQNGLLVPVTGDFAAGLKELCDNSDLRKAFGIAARQRAEKLDWKPIFDELEQRYLNLVNEHESRHPRERLPALPAPARMPVVA